MEPKYYSHKKCNICLSKKRSIVFSFSQQKLVRCLDCNLIYLDKQRTDFENLYNNDYYSLGKGAELSANYTNYESQEKVIENNFKFAYDHISRSRKKRKRLLEIGAGFGFFPKFLPKDILYESIEVSSEAANEIKKQNYEVYNADFMDITFSKKYDYVVGFDVIEHQIYLKEFLKKVHTILKPNGVFIFTTPDYDSLLNRIFGSNAPMIQPMYHNYYFDQKWIKKNLRLIGFRIKFINTVYITYLSIGQVLLMGSFALPFIKKLPLNTIAKKLHIENIIVPFIRFGGIECIAQKV